MDKIDINKAKCTKLSFEAGVEFLKGNDTALSGFKIEAYTGAVVDRWWGKLAIAIDGITSKQQMPIFKNHDSGEIVGYSTQATNESNFSVTGVFSKATEAAKEVMALAQEGFPWQASIGVKPKVVMELKENASMIVNGESITGPAEVWTESEVLETSFVPLGADGNSSVAVFSELEEVAKPVATINRGKKMDLETLKKEHPDLVVAITKEATAGFDEQLAEARKAGAEGELNRIKSVKGQEISGHEDLIESCMWDGVTTGPEAAVKVLAAEKLVREGVLESLKNDAPKPLDDPSTDGDLGDNGTPEEKAKKKWDKDTQLQADFNGEFERYVAYLEEDSGIKFKTISKEV